MMKNRKFVKQQMSPANAATLQSTVAKAAPRSGLLGGSGGGPPSQMGARLQQAQSLQAALNTAPQPPMAQKHNINSTLGGIGAPKPGFQNPPSMRLTAPTGPAPVGPPTTPAAAARMKKGGKVAKPPVKKYAKGGSTASKRADGCATKGKTKGRFV